MGFLTKDQVLERFRSDGRNSSHFVWLLARLEYYACANGWVFGFQRVGDVTLIALEPLIPGAPAEYGPEHAEAFKVAWAEFAQTCQVKISAFASVYEPFAKLISAAGFTTLKVGQEPWVDLKDCIPTGNAGKGVRNARNQALLRGLRVEEWKPEEIISNLEKKAVLREIHDEWRSTRLVELSGFMNSTDPFEYMSERRYFVLKSPNGRVESYLVATPVPGRQGYFLEDLVTRSNAPKGAGELITLEAMVALGEAQAKEASLGVVSLTTMDAAAGKDLPPLIRFLMIQIPTYMSAIYNFSGMEIYRKRFKPRAWEAIHVGLKNDKPDCSDTMAWLKFIFALLVAFRPRVRLTRQWIWSAVTEPINRTPLTILFASISMLLFWRVNHFGELPDWALARYGFFARANLSEWIYRSVVSDLLYFDQKHFLSCALPLFGLMYWAERSHRRSFFVIMFLATSVLDDIINYWVLIAPFQHFHPTMFTRLIAYKDVGGSLVLAVLVGMQVCQFRVIREPLVAVITLASVLGFAFTSARLEFLILNLNHAIFFVLGFLIGKADFEYSRHLSRAASRKKPPTAKSVLPPTSKKKAA